MIVLFQTVQVCTVLPHTACVVDIANLTSHVTPLLLSEQQQQQQQQQRQRQRRQHDDDDSNNTNNINNSNNKLIAYKCGISNVRTHC